MFLVVNNDTVYYTTQGATPFPGINKRLKKITYFFA